MKWLELLKSRTIIAALAAIVVLLIQNTLLAQYLGGVTQEDVRAMLQLIADGGTTGGVILGILTILGRVHARPKE